MKKILVQGLLVGVAMLMISLVFGQGLNFLFPSLAKEYTNPNLFRPWSDPVMLLYFLYPFVLGVILAAVWQKTKRLFESGSVVKRGMSFGLSYWVISSIPGMFITYSSFTVSLPLVISWSLSGLITAVGAGLVFAKLNK